MQKYSLKKNAHDNSDLVLFSFQIYSNNIFIYDDYINGYINETIFFIIMLNKKQRREKNCSFYLEKQNAYYIGKEIFFMIS